ncbi:MAG TPA: cupin domain-containing protein [Candidatus Binataceae bacterium]|nr:cupin domain-containing protein [Candidatus Binataceae bacterium]
MAKRTSLSQQLDLAVEAIMSSPPAAQRKLDPKVAALMRVAAELRDLPRAQFKARLKSELAAHSSGPPLTPAITREFTEAQIFAILDQIERQPPLVPHDISAALADLPDCSMRFLAPVNECTLVASYARTPTRWERHPGGNEMLYIVDGAVEVVTLTDAGPVTSVADTGSIFICPRGLWHRQIPRPFVRELSLTPGAGTEGSDLADPRRADAPAMTPRAARVAPPSVAGRELPAYDVLDAAARVAPLAITDKTTAQEADAAFLHLTDCDRLSLGVMRYSGRTPWERHPDGDELLYALDGEVEVTALAGDGAPTARVIRAGEALVCPRGVWHRQMAREFVTTLFATANKTTQISFADDPRAEA